MKFRRSKSGYIYAEFTTSEGTQRVSTKTKSFEQARLVAHEKKFREIEQAAKADALTSEVIMRLTAGRRVTVSDALNEYIESLRINRLKELTISSMAYKLRAWARDQGIERKPIYRVGRENIDSQVNTSRPLALSTRRTILWCLKEFMSFCVARGWRLDNPAVECRVVIDDLPYAQRLPRRREMFTQDELQRLIESTANDPFWHTTIQLAYHHGLWLSDCATLEWDSYDKPNGKLSIVLKKTDAPTIFDLSPSLRRILDTLPHGGTRYVFPAQAATWIDPRSTSNLSQQFRRLCQRLGIHGKSFNGLPNALRVHRWKQAEEARS